MNRFPSVAVRDAASAQALPDLAFESAVGLPAEFSDVLGVHRAVDGEQELGVIAARMEPLIHEVEIDAAESQLPEVLDRIDHVARQPGGVVDENEVEGRGLGRAAWTRRANPARPSTLEPLTASSA